MKPTSRCVHFGIALLGFAASGYAMAQEPNPYYIGASQALTYQSNLFLAPDGQPSTSDTVSTTSLLFGIDQPFSGRQRFYVNGKVNRNLYKDNDQLNYTGWGVSTGLDWEAMERLAGRIAYTSNRTLDTGSDQGPLTTSRNEETTQEFVASVKYGLVSLLSLEGGWTHQSVDYSAITSNYLEFKQDTLGLGLNYKPSGLLTLGTGVRHTKGEYPDAVQTGPDSFQADDYDRNDFDVTAIWVPTGASTVRARISYTDESHDLVKSRDFSGVTGALAWEYRPTAKLFFVTEANRATGSDAAFNQTVGGGSLNSSQYGGGTQVSDVLQLTAQYEATAKIQLEANVQGVWRDLVSTFALPSGSASTSEGTDRLIRYGLGVNYAPLRNVLVGCSAAREKRTTSSVVSYPYDANFAGCSAQFKLQ